MSTLADAPFLRACRGQSVRHTPVWFMRQAGRSLPEYRDVRAGISMLDACMRADLVAEITLQPVRRYAVDAAVLFSDIVVPLKAAGVELEIRPGVGPVVERPFRSERDLDRLPPLQPDQLPHLRPAIGELVAKLGAVPLVGFAGGPFTLASYLVDGGPSKNHEATKTLMYGNPARWHALLERLAAITGTFLRAQAEAGASAVQLFDSWIGTLAPEDYRRYVLPHTKRVLAGLADLGVPRIHFGVGTGELLGLMSEAGAEVVGVDWRVPLDAAAQRVTASSALQGNLDPTVLFAPWPVVAEQARDVLARGRAGAGHVFNLGHGVLPATDPDVLARLTDFVHEESARTGGDVR